MSASVLPMKAANEPVVTLRQRVADALTKPTTSAELRSCIAHTQADLGRVDRERERAEAMAVDPLSSEDEATEGKRDAESLRFDHERLTMSVTRLTGRLDVVLREEGQAVRRVVYDAAVAARDAAADKMRAVYPKAAGEIRAALVELAAADEQVTKANRELPDGANYIAAPEVIVNGGRALNGAGDQWPISAEICLPGRYGLAEPWPPRQSAL